MTTNPRTPTDPMLRDWILPPNLQYLIKGMRGAVPRAHYRRFLREMVAWFVPTEVQSLLLSTYYNHRGGRITSTAELKNRYENARRCFVIGNGPSLGDMDLRPLAGEHSIVHNSFYKHPNAKAVDPDFLCIADESFFEDETKTVEWHRIIEGEMPNVSLMLHLSARPLIAKHDLYRNHETHFYQHGITVNHPDLVHFDFMKPRNVGHTAGTRLGIPLAIYLGFKEIYLVGFDANWLDDYEGTYHFYDTHDQWPEFDSLNADYRQPRYEDQLIFAARDYHSHYLLASAAPKVGVRIYNATSGGHLDMYPRVRFDTLFDRHRADMSSDSGG